MAKGKRRARGTGALFFNEKRGVWVGRVIVGRKPSGGALYAERSARTQAACLRKLAAAGPPGADTTVAQWAERWLASLDVRTGTRRLIEANCRNHFLPTLGGKRLAAVTAWDVEVAHRKWAASLGPNTIGTALGHLGLMFSAAHRAGLVAANPVPLAKRPRRVGTEIDPFAPDELARIVVAAGAEPSTRPLALAAATGCRMGEAVGLDVTGFDPAAGTIGITQAYNDGHGLGPPKTARGVRTIAVPALALPVLVAAAGGRKAGPVFVAPLSGARLSQSTARKAFARVLKRLGLRDRNPHQLRHSVATAMLAAGDHLGDVAEYLGDTVETIVKTYTHPTGKSPVHTMNRLLGGG